MDIKAVMQTEHEFSHAVAERADNAGHRAVSRLIGEVNGRTGDNLDQFMQGVINDTKTFGIAQHLIDHLSGFTEALDNGLNKSKPLFGQIDGEKKAKAEIVRLVWLANWLAVAVAEVNKVKQAENMAESEVK